ncbi:MAG: isoprenylcysteine carboxylmethyltransferase family protein [Desulfobulbaceae bacterium]|nr:isoprenylcysteine carboxylmethyltransferase family protein [Desulfobulbaceae bacterium]
MGNTPKTQKTPRMGRLGIGPLFASISICYFVATFFVTVRFAPGFRIYLLSDFNRCIISAIFIATGLIFYGFGVKSMLTAYNADKLCTTGPFAICRHPIYSAWMCFLVPGLAFWTNTLPSFTTPVIMYLLFKMIIVKEDRYLKERFGTEYLRYRKNTPEILPLGWIKRATKQAFP